ncbi:hypothetical protein FKM82_008428 [Ascaphus truei]
MYVQLILFLRCVASAAFYLWTYYFRTIWCLPETILGVPELYQYLAHLLGNGHMQSQVQYNGLRRNVLPCCLNALNTFGVFKS